MNMQTMSLQRLNEALDVFFRSHGYERRIKEEDVLRCWQGVVGNTVARVADPISMKNGILRVHVKNSVWRMELIYLEEDIRVKLNRKVDSNIVVKIIFC